MVHNRRTVAGTRRPATMQGDGPHADYLGVDMPDSTAPEQDQDALRSEVRAAISNAYYDARNTGRTMEHAADEAADRVMACLSVKAGA